MASSANDLRHLEEPIAGPSDRPYPPTTSAIVSEESHGNGNGNGNGGPRRERSESGSAGSRGSLSGPMDVLAGLSSEQVPQNGKPGYGMKKRGKDDDAEEKKPKKTRQTRECNDPCQMLLMAFGVAD